MATRQNGDTSKTATTKMVHVAVLIAKVLVVSKTVTHQRRHVVSKTATHPKWRQPRRRQPKRCMSPFWLRRFWLYPKRRHAKTATTKTATTKTVHVAVLTVSPFWIRHFLEYKSTGRFGETSSWMCRCFGLSPF